MTHATQTPPRRPPIGARWPSAAGALLPGVLALACSLLISGTAPGQGAPLAVPTALVGGRDMGIPFHSLAGVAVDPAHGEIHAADAGRHEITTFDTAGALLGSFVHVLTGPDGARVDGRPNWLAVDRAGRLLVADLDATWVDVLDVRGRPVGRIELPGDAVGLDNGPGPLAAAPDGRLFVASRGHEGRVHVFGPDLRHLATWGEPGRDSTQLSGITGLGVDPEGRVWVTCAGTRLCVQVFDDAGRYQFGFGLHDMGPENFSLPAGVAFTADGRAWIGDEIRQTVQVYDRTGAYLGVIGGMGNRPGQFQFPRALASDGRSMLVVAERVGNRFQVWRSR